MYIVQCIMYIVITTFNFTKYSREKGAIWLQHLFILRCSSISVSCNMFHVYTMYNVYCTMYNVYCTMYNVQCILYNINAIIQDAVLTLLLYTMQ